MQLFLRAAGFGKRSFRRPPFFFIRLRRRKEEGTFVSIFNASVSAYNFQTFWSGNFTHQAALWKPRVEIHSLFSNSPHYPLVCAILLGGSWPDCFLSGQKSYSSAKNDRLAYLRSKGLFQKRGLYALTMYVGTVPHAFPPSLSHERRKPNPP